MLSAKKLLYHIVDELSALKEKPSSWEYVGDVYWWGNSWTCPADGFIEFKVGPNASNWYWYISNSKAGTAGWSHCMTGNNTNQQSLTVFVKQGAVLKTAMINSVNTANAYYYKFV